MSAPQYDTPVLIAGGGPTGLMTALLLARQGIRPLLVERRPDTSIHPRARGLNVRTMEILRSVGLDGAVREAGRALAASRYMLFVDTLAGEEIRRVPDTDLLPSGEALARVTPCDWCACAQDELEPVLAAAARAHGADLRFGTALTSLVQTSDDVTAVLVDHATGVRSTIRAPYVVAADGARGTLRDALGIGTSGPGPAGSGQLGHFVNIYCRADLADLVRGREFILCFVERPGAEGLLMAVDNADRWLFNVEYDLDRGESPVDFTPERCIALIRAAAGLPGLKVEVLSVLPWEGAAHVADRFRAGHVFLAGDAAHVMPPAGGFGLNTGVGDAHNLAWKLALVLRGVAGAGLLDSYEAERQPLARMVVERAVQELAAHAPDAPAGADSPGPAGPPESAWSDGPPEDAWSGDAGDPLAQLPPILGHRYASTAVVPEDDDSGVGDVGWQPGVVDAGDGAATGPGQPAVSATRARDGLDLTGRPGTRAPHLWVARAGVRLSTLDLYDGRFVLLAGAAGDAWCEAARSVAARLGVALDAYRLGPATDDGIDLVCLEADWTVAHGVLAGGAVLVRPDGTVAWRSRDIAANSSHASTLERVLSRLLCRSVGVPV